MSKFGGYDDYPFLAEFYDYVPGYAGRSDIDFYVSFSRSSASKTLELGCGTGRILIPTAAAGCQIVGVDLSEYMLAKCREKLQKQPKEVRERVKLVHGTITSFKLEESFGLITTPFRSFQHLISLEEQLACLRCANNHLSMGGMLILDLFQVNLRYITNPASTDETEDFSNIKLLDGRKLSRTHRIASFHRAEQYNDVEMIYYITHPDGREERLVQAFPFRYFFRYEVEHLLSRCGFNAVDIFGNFDKSPLRDDSPEMIFVAEKTRNTNAGEDSR